MIDETITRGSCETDWKPTGSKGYYTNTFTKFGRHYKIFDALKIELRKNKPSAVNCLIIGPGRDSDVSENDRLCATYQPYELANALIRSGVKEYDIDVLDINPQVLSEMDKDPLILKIYERFDYFSTGINSDIDTSIDSKTYYQSFLKDHTLEIVGNYRLIEVTKDITSRIHPAKADIITDELSRERYDIVICTVLLSHYSVDATWDRIDPIPKTLRKIEDAVRKDGYLIDSQKYTLDSDWICIANSNRHSYTMHDPGAALFRKN